MDVASTHGGRRASLVVCALLVSTVVAEGQTWAHGSSGERLTLRMQGDVIYVQATPAAALFARFDTDKDGRFSKAEVKGRREAMVKHFLSQLELRDSEGRGLKLIFWDLNPLHTHDKNGKSRFVRVTLRQQLKKPSETLWLAYRGGKVAPLSLIAARSRSVSQAPREVTRARLSGARTTMTLFKTTSSPPKRPSKRR